MTRVFSRMGIRDRLLLAVVGTVAVALAIMTVAFNLLLSASLRSDADKRLRSMVEDTARMISISNGRVSLPKPTGDIQELGTQVWVFVAGTTFSAPEVDPAVAQAAKALDGQPAQYVDIPGKEVRLYGVPLVYEDERIGTIVAGLWMGSYLRTQRLTLLATGALSAVLLVIVGFAGRWVLNAAFRPVARMTAEAEAWSTADLDRRFDMGEPHDELTQLAHTLDGLLDRLAASLRRERRFSAEVSHQLRTPLAKIKAEAELALRREREPSYYREALSSIMQSADQLARTVEALMAAAQEEGTLARGRAEVSRVLEDVVAAVSVLAEERGVEVAVAPLVRRTYVGVERDIAVQILQPVVENACRFARSKVTLAAVRTGKEVVFTVEDDGPGVAEEEKEKIFEPGVRGSAAAAEAGGSTRGAGLGLSLARRLARAASGEVEVGASTIGTGARFLVHLPTG
ncbi:MAG: HAMP domain-containing histidine kinase [Thermoleophilia bacterium]|nr:HAMP domain-containing histidine kinase [Thermoleophilia bacterium]